MLNKYENNSALFYEGNLYIRYVYEGILTGYFVNICNEGVFSIATGKLLKPIISRDGYVNYVIYVNGEKHYLGYHQLVAGVCIPMSDDPNATEIDHLDGIKEHNEYTNLERVTRGENVRRSVALGLKKGLRGEDNGSCKYNDNQIHFIMKLLESGVSISTLVNELGVTTTLVYGLASGTVRSDISKLYTLPESIYKHKHTNKRADKDTKMLILELKSKGYGAKQISEETGINFQVVKNVYYYRKNNYRFNDYRQLDNHIDRNI